MNSRERMLVLVTGGILVAAGLQMGLSKYRKSRELAESQVDGLRNQLTDKQDQRILGSMANNRMAELRQKSLPSNPERAVAFYQRWLTDQVERSGLASPAVDYVSAQAISKLYRQYAFKVTGSGDLPQIAKLMDAFYSRDVLHRIRSFSVTPDRNRSGQLQLMLDIDAISLNDAPDDRPLPGTDKPNDAPLGTAALALLNRNPLSPPNQPPRYTGEAKPRATLNKPFEFTPKFDDPEGRRIEVAIQGETPSGLELKSGRMTWQPTALGEYSFVVKATDAGLPPKSTEQQITINVTDAPPPAPPEPTPQFDESRTAVLTGLVRNGEVWQAWISLRTKGKVLRLNVGDELDIGAVKGKVSEINDQHAVIVSGEVKMIVKPGDNLADAKAR